MTLAPMPSRHTMTAIAACIAVVAFVAGCGGAGRRDSSPGDQTRSPASTAATLAVGPPLATYVDPDRLVLYIHGVAVPGTWGGASSVGDLTLAVDNSIDRIGLFLAGSRIGTLHHVVDGVVEVSPDARSIAWIEAVGGSVHLVAGTVNDSGVHELGRLRLDPAVLQDDSEGSERVMHIDDDHVVTYGGVTSGHSWVPGAAPEDADVTAYETRAPGFPNSVDPPALNPAGTWGAWPTNAKGRSPRDIEQPLGAVTVQQPRRPETRFTFVMPHGEGVQWVFWETDVDVIAAVSSTPPTPGGTTEAEAWVRCNVRTDVCEYAPTPGGD